MNLSARLRKIAGPRPWGWREPREPSLTEWLAVAEHLELKPNTNTKRMAPQLEAEFGPKGLWSHYGYPDQLQVWIGGPCPTRPSPREGLIDPDELRAHPRYVMLRATHRKQTSDFLCETSDVTDEGDLHEANFGKRGPEDIPLVPKHFLRDGGHGVSGALTRISRDGADLIKGSIVGLYDSVNEDYRSLRIRFNADAGPLARMYAPGYKSKLQKVLWSIFEPQARTFLHSMGDLGLPFQVAVEPKTTTVSAVGAYATGVIGFYTKQQFDLAEAFVNSKDAQAMTDHIAYTLRDTLARDPAFTNMLREEPKLPGPPDSE